jgi:hypothetical protein
MPQANAAIKPKVSDSIARFPSEHLLKTGLMDQSNATHLLCNRSLLFLSLNNYSAHATSAG